MNISKETKSEGKRVSPRGDTNDQRVGLGVARKPSRLSIYDLIILGAGPTGLSAAVYASRYKLNYLVIGRDPGVITKTTEIANYLGEQHISGPDLYKKFKDHAEKLGAKIKSEEIIQIKKHKDKFIIKTSKKEYSAKKIIYSLGGSKRKLHIKGEKELIGRGVSYCATCDAAFFENKKVIIIGSGDAGLESAILLSEYAKKVYINCRTEKIKGSPNLLKKFKRLKNTEFLCNTIIKEIIGERFVEKIKLQINKKSKLLNIDGVFIEIGYNPNTELAQNIGVKVSKDKRIKVNKEMETNIKGFFAAGDATTGSNTVDQIVTGVAEGAIATRTIYFQIKEEK